MNNVRIVFFPANWPFSVLLKHFGLTQPQLVLDYPPEYWLKMEWASSLWYVIGYVCILMAVRFKPAWLLLYQMTECISCPMKAPWKIIVGIVKHKAKHKHQLGLWNTDNWMLTWRGRTFLFQLSILECSRPFFMVVFYIYGPCRPAVIFRLCLP